MCRTRVSSSPRTRCGGVAVVLIERITVKRLPKVFVHMFGNRLLLFCVQADIRLTQIAYDTTIFARTLHMNWSKRWYAIRIVVRSPLSSGVTYISWLMFVIFAGPCMLYTIDAAL